MRVRVLLFSIIILAVCSWLVIHRKAEALGSAASPVVAVVATNQNPGGGPKATVAAPVPSALEAAAAVAPNATPTSAPSTVNPTANELLQKPIDFYGQVLDERNNPVAGARIAFRWDDLTAKDWTQTATATSDTEGLFSLQNGHGATLTVAVSKEGYYTPRSGQEAFHYAFGNPNYSSAPHNPTIFHLRQKGKGASLVEKDFPTGIGKIWQLHHDGTPVALNLLEGTQAPAGSGQLKLEFWRDISDRKAQQFDWKLQITALSGGLIPTEEEFAFEAPETGYQQSIVITMLATNQVWQGELRSRYYIQLPNGDYGRIDSYLLPYNGVFTVHSAINPTGSRNLETLQ